MATFALIHGGSGSAWDWHLVIPALQEHGQDAVAVDLPSDDESAGWDDYADAVVEAIGDRRGVVATGTRTHTSGAVNPPSEWPTTVAEDGSACREPRSRRRRYPARQDPHPAATATTSPGSSSCSPSAARPPAASAGDQHSVVASVEQRFDPIVPPQLLQPPASEHGTSSEYAP
jgi:pimeloyl-ACP methyl ester carboxylesterase